MLKSKSVISLGFYIMEILNNENTTLIIQKLKREEKQYPPLNKQQERELINKYKDDREKLEYLLFMHNIRMVFKIAKKYANKTTDFDNLIQQGLLGLQEGCKRFDITKDNKFITYATNWIRKRILEYFYQRQHLVDKNSISLEEVQNTSKLQGFEEKDQVCDYYIYKNIDKTYNTTIQPIDDELSVAEQKSLCNNLILKINDDTSLSSIDKEIFYKLFYNKEKPKSLAEEYNLSTQTIANIKNRILHKMKNILHNEYNINSFYDIKI